MSESKKIEPTDAMVEAGANILSVNVTGISLRFHTDGVKCVYLKSARSALRAALNHPDAPGLFADEDATRAAREQGWDDAAQHIYNKGWEGVTALRKANPHRPALELPTEKGAVIVPADGHEYIGATRYGRTWRTVQAVLDSSGAWVGAWCSGADVIAYVRPDEITPGPWKVEEK